MAQPLASVTSSCLWLPWCFHILHFLPSHPYHYSCLCHWLWWDWGLLRDLWSMPVSSNSNRTYSLRVSYWGPTSGIVNMLNLCYTSIAGKTFLWCWLLCLTKWHVHSESLFRSLQNSFNDQQCRALEGKVIVVNATAQQSVALLLV